MGLFSKLPKFRFLGLLPGVLVVSKIYFFDMKDFPHSLLVKNPPANAGDTGSIPGPGRFLMPQCN